VRNCELKYIVSHFLTFSLSHFLSYDKRGNSMKRRRTWVYSDPHIFHEKLITIGVRPPDFQDQFFTNYYDLVRPNDRVISLGDMAWKVNSSLPPLLLPLPGYKILVRGNHDRSKSCNWWMNNGFDFCCDGFRERNIYFSHEPVDVLPDGCDINIHGHLHDIWNSHHNEYIPKPFHFLFSLEYENYKPVLLDVLIERWKKLNK